MTAEPLRSAMSFGSVGETSLALPSDNKLRTGQQRVLDQVHTIKRSKSRQGQNGSLSPTSPTSPQMLSVFTEFGSFKFAPSKANGTISPGNYNTSFHKRANYQKARSVSCKTMGRRIASTSGQWDQRFSTSNWPSPPNGLKPSRSDPALAGAPLVAAPPPPRAPASPILPLSPVPPGAGGPAMALLMRAKAEKSSSSQQTTMQSSSQTRYSKQSTYSMTNGTVQTVNAQTKSSGRPLSVLSLAKTTKTEQQSSVNMSDLTLKEAVEFLSHAEENYQLCGASFIQHATFKEEPPKEEVLELGGIPALVALLQSPNADVSQSASAALRNLVFRNQANKLEVQQAGGIGWALKLLKETDSTETQRQLTGLLWNLSSADELKEELIATALPVLTESVVVPFTCWSDSSANNNIHPDVYYSATGCLRNLSCAQEKERQAMRDCRGLIDSIMSYVESCVAEENPDDKSVENCACILHNLTYQLEVESPECFAKYNPPEDTAVAKKNPTIGCFSAKSSKIPKEIKVDLEESDDSNPSGVNWLCHPKALKTYLSLLGSSQKDATLEACCGALQNLTATKGPGSNAMSQLMVQKLGALHYISPLIQSPNPGLQKTAMSLMGNLSRTSSLQLSMARQLLPELAGRLSSGAKEMGNCDDTIASTCHTVRSLLPVDAEVSRKIINNELVTSLTDISENDSFPKGSKAASLLLYNLWHEKSLQGTLKKLGMAKALFINDTTTAAHKSVQVIE